MTHVPSPQAGDPLFPEDAKTTRAVVEVFLAGLAYIAIALLFVASVDFGRLIPKTLSPEARDVGAGFLEGVLVQVVLVVALVLISRDMRSAIGRTFALGNPAAWGAAFIAVAIHSATLVFFFMDEPSLVFRLSNENIILSGISAVDGWSQEVMFRGYVIYRLARSGAPVIVQIVLSAFLFSAIHLGYAGEGLWDAFFPFFGTAVLGGFFAWSVLLGRGALLPVIAAHVLLIVIVQPWLALAG